MKRLASFLVAVLLLGVALPVAALGWPATAAFYGYSYRATTVFVATHDRELIAQFGRRVLHHVEDLGGRVFAEAVGQHAACGSGTNDHIVEFVRHRTTLCVISRCSMVPV